MNEGNLNQEVIIKTEDLLHEEEGEDESAVDPLEHNGKVCQFCSQSFKNSNNYYIHVSKEHVEQAKETWFGCDQCPKYFPVRLLLKQHQTMTHCRSPCPFCKLISSTRQSLIEHVNKAHSQLASQVWFQCSFCKNYYPTEKTLSNHVARKHTTKKSTNLMPCSICYQSFRSKESLNRHLNSSHQDFLAGNQDWEECSKCSTYFEKDKMKIHLTLAHRSKYFKLEQLAKLKCNYVPKGMQCRFCDEVIRNKQLYYKHNNEKHEEYIKESWKICEKCKIYFPSSTDVLDHLVKGHDYSEKCTFCQKNFTTLHTFKQHHYEHHREITTEKFFICSVCLKFQSSASSLADHERAHHQNQRVNRCQFCNLTKSRPADIVKHVNREHLQSVEKIWPKCAVCSLFLPSENHLSNHMRLSHKIIYSASQSFAVGKFPCRFCPFTFSEKMARQKHVNLTHKTETEKKGWRKCSKCEVSFQSVFGLNMHIWRVHTSQEEGYQSSGKGMVFKCSICHKHFDYRYKILPHAMKFHRKEVKRKWKKCLYCSKYVEKKRVMKHHVGRVHGADIRLLSRHRVRKIASVKVSDDLMWSECKYCFSFLETSEQMEIHVAAYHISDQSKDVFRAEDDNLKNSTTNESTDSNLLISGSKESTQEQTSMSEKQSEKNKSEDSKRQSDLTARNAQSSTSFKPAQERTEQTPHGTNSNPGELKLADGKSPKRQFKCDFCQRLFSSRSDGLYHLNTFHKSGLSEIGFKKCHQCNKDFQNAFGLRCHIYGTHLIEQIDTSSKTALDTRDETTNISNDNDNVKNPNDLSTSDLFVPSTENQEEQTSLLEHPEDGKFEDSQEQQKIFRLYQKRRPIRKHPCEFCPKVFACPKEHLKHLNKFHKSDLIAKGYKKCHICEKYLRTEIGLRIHYKFHVGRPDLILKEEKLNYANEHDSDNKLSEDIQNQGDEPAPRQAVKKPMVVIPELAFETLKEETIRPERQAENENEPSHDSISTIDFNEFDFQVKDTKTINLDEFNTQNQNQTNQRISEIAINLDGKNTEQNNFRVQNTETKDSVLKSLLLEETEKRMYDKEPCLNKNIVNHHQQHLEQQLLHQLQPIQQQQHHLLQQPQHQFKEHHQLQHLHHQYSQYHHQKRLQQCQPQPEFQHYQFQPQKQQQYQQDQQQQSHQQQNEDSVLKKLLSGEKEMIGDSHILQQQQHHNFKQHQPQLSQSQQIQKGDKVLKRLLCTEKETIGDIHIPHQHHNLQKHHQQQSQQRQNEDAVLKRLLCGEKEIIVDSHIIKQEPHSLQQQQSKQQHQQQHNQQHQQIGNGPYNLQQKQSQSQQEQNRDGLLKRLLNGEKETPQQHHNLNLQQQQQSQYQENRDTALKRLLCGDSHNSQQHHHNLLQHQEIDSIPMNQYQIGISLRQGLAGNATAPHYAPLLTEHYTNLSKEPVLHETNLEPFFGKTKETQIVFPKPENEISDFKVSESIAPAATAAGADDDLEILESVDQFVNSLSENNSDFNMEDLTAGNSVENEEESPNKNYVQISEFF